MKWVSIVAAVLLLFLQAAGHADSGAFLGVRVGRLDASLAQELQYGGKGVFVTGVMKGSGAEEAGIKARDVIVELDGDRIARRGHVRDLLSFRSPGDRVEVKVWRCGETHTITAELGEHEGVPKQVEKATVAPHEPMAWLGLEVGQHAQRSR